MTNRRTFTRGMVQTLTAAALANQLAWAKPKASMQVDTHAHIFAKGLPLAAQHRYAPNYDAPLEQYLAMLDRFSMAKGVLIQPSFLGTDNSYLLAALKARPDRLRGVIVIDPAKDTPILKNYDRAGCVGIRLNLIGLPDPDLSTPSWLMLFAELRRLNWLVEFQVEASRLQKLTAPVLDHGLRIVVDHFGRPDPAAGVDDPGFRALLALGKNTPSVGQAFRSLSQRARWTRRRNRPCGHAVARRFLRSESLGLGKRLAAHAV